MRMNVLKRSLLLIVFSLSIFSLSAQEEQTAKVGLGLGNKAPEL